MFCKQCGAQIPDTATFCTSCGKAVERTSGVETPQPAPVVQPAPAVQPAPVYREQPKVVNNTYNYTAPAGSSPSANSRLRLVTGTTWVASPSAVTVFRRTLQPPK